MACNEHLAERVHQSLKRQGADFEEKKMFGGICFMVDDKMCVGVVKDNLMARLGPENEEMRLSKPGAQKMDFTGKRMRGFYFVSAEGLDLEDQLDKWVKACLDFNPIARSSKKKSK